MGRVAGYGVTLENEDGNAEPKRLSFWDSTEIEFQSAETGFQKAVVGDDDDGHDSDEYYH